MYNVIGIRMPKYLFYLISWIVVCNAINIDLDSQLDLTCSIYGGTRQRDQQRTALMKLANCSTPECALSPPDNPFIDNPDACKEGDCLTAAVRNLLVYDATKDSLMLKLQQYFIQKCGIVNGVCQSGLTARQLGCIHDRCISRIPVPKIDSWILAAYIGIATILFINANNIDYLDIHTYKIRSKK